MAEERKLEIKEYDKLVKEEIDEENLYEEFSEEKNDISVTNISYVEKKFTIYFYFILNKKKEFVFPIESDCFNINIQYGYELIENIINKINNESIIIDFNSKKYIIFLKDCKNEYLKKDFYTNNYELRLFKKSISKPKYDLPPFWPSASLDNFSNEHICLLCKNKLNIMLLEYFENNEEEKEKDEEEKNESENEEEENESKEIKKIIIKKQNSKFDKYDESRSKSICIII